MALQWLEAQGQHTMEGPAIKETIGRADKVPRREARCAVCNGLSLTIGMYFGFVGLDFSVIPGLRGYLDSLGKSMVGKPDT